MAGHHLDQFSRLKMLFHVIGWDLDCAAAWKKDPLSGVIGA